MSRSRTIYRTIEKLEGSEGLNKRTVGSTGGNVPVSEGSIS